MKMTQNTQTYAITLAEIASDFDDPTRLELTFIAELRRDYLTTIPAAEHSAVLADILADLANDDADSIFYEFNVASRHNDHCLYAIISGDRSGDYIDDLDDAVYAFGQPIIDFIADACRLLNVPFYPNA